MRIKKKEKSIGIIGKILNLFSNSKEDTYSCNYINKQLEDTGWITAGGDYSNEYWKYTRYRKKNGMVTIICRSAIETIAGQYTVVFTLPEGFRPKYTIPFTCHMVGGDSSKSACFIQPDGTIECFSPTSGQHPAFSVTFPID